MKANEISLNDNVVYFNFETGYSVAAMDVPNGALIELHNANNETVATLAINHASYAAVETAAKALHSGWLTGYERGRTDTVFKR